MELFHDFYIIESLKDGDVEDGLIFNEALDSIKKVPKYKNVKNIEEFKDALKDFENSRYKYLLISSHADEENLQLTDEDINAEDFEDFEIKFDQRRIFMSTCYGGSFLFAKYFIRNGAYSVVGTPDKLKQIVAIGMWPTMLIVFERLSNTILKFSELNKTMRLMSEVYQINLHYYSFLRNKKSMKEYIYLSGIKTSRKDYPL
jgi:hypothetical protein